MLGQPLDQLTQARRSDRLAAKLAMPRMVRQQYCWHCPHIKPQPLQSKARRAIADMAADHFRLDGYDRVRNGVLAPQVFAARVPRK